MTNTPPPSVDTHVLTIARRKRLIYTAAMLLISCSTLPTTIASIATRDPHVLVHMLTNGFVVAVCLTAAWWMRKPTNVTRAEAVFTFAGWMYVYSWDVVNLIFARFPVDDIGGDAAIALIPVMLTIFWVKPHRIIPAIATLLGLHFVMRWVNLAMFEWSDLHSRILTSDLVMGSVATLATLAGTYAMALNQSSQATDHMRDLANTDALTGLPNRRALTAQLQTRARTPVVLVDVDDFKVLNDTLGHQQGDAALQDIAHVLADVFEGHGTVGRWGGEEFLGLLPNVPAQEAAGIVEQARRQVEHLNGNGCVTISLGLTMMTAADAPDEALDRCDALMYRAKRSGKNTCCTDISVLQAAPHLLLVSPPEGPTADSCA